MSPRELRVVSDGPIHARVGEGVFWQVDTTNFGGSPTSVSVAAFDANGIDVTVATISGSAVVTGNLVKLPKFTPLTVGKHRLIISFTNAQFAPAKPDMEVTVVS